MSFPALLADIGGTHARFALAGESGGASPSIDLPSSGFGDLAAPAREALRRFAAGDIAAQGVRTAAVAVAGPIDGDAIELTNVSWRFSIEATRRELGLERLIVVNDLVAYGWAIPTLAASELETVCTGNVGRRGNRGVVAVGTGLGTVTVVEDPYAVVASEGGHRDLAAVTEREWDVRERLAARFGGHVSYERAVSGSGLAWLWEALAELAGEAGGKAVPDGKEIARRARGGDARAREVVELFSGWLGAYAGDLALMVVARGGIYLSGGVLAGAAPALDVARFRERFLEKGRFREWMARIPVHRILAEEVAFAGLAELVRRS